MKEFTDIILALATCILAYFTYVLFIETRNIRKIQTDPHVVCYVDYLQYFPILYLVVRNEGSGPAYDVRFKFNYSSYDKIDTSSIKNKFDNLNLLNNGLSFINKEQEFKFVFYDALKKLEEYKKIRITCNIKYKNKSGESYEDTYYLSFGHFDGIYLENNYLKKISDNIDEINKKFKSS